MSKPRGRKRTQSIIKEGTLYSPAESASDLTQEVITAPNEGTDPQSPTEKTRKAFLYLALIFTSSVCVMVVLYSTLPPLSDEERAAVTLPKNIDDAKRLGEVLLRYRTDHYYSVLFGMLLTYIFLQSFAIPGSIFLTILYGFLFPFPIALSLVCLCSASGASFCYILSFLIGRPIIMKYFAEKVCAWAVQVSNNKGDLLYYIIFLRITPFIPNWLINISSPILDIPLGVFFWATFLGVAPPSMMYIQAGQALYQLTSQKDAFNTLSVVLIACAALVSLAPVIFKNQLNRTHSEVKAK